MPRVAREKSSTGIYHVMQRGVNHQIIFEDDEDYQTYLDTLKEYQKKSGYIIYAYCLMSNHLHLLIKEEAEDLGIALEGLGLALSTGIIGNMAVVGTCSRIGIKAKWSKMTVIFRRWFVTYTKTH